jgi:hypothetical protein
MAPLMAVCATFFYLFPLYWNFAGGQALFSWPDNDLGAILLHDSGEMSIYISKAYEQN